MPTPSDQRAEWAAHTDRPRRSVFGNYPSAESSRENAESPTPSAAAERRNFTATLQTSIDVAVARSYIYCFLARAFEDSTVEGWNWLTSPDSRTAIRAAAAAISAGQCALTDCLNELLAALQPQGFEAFLDAQVAAFGHAARGRCPLNEIEYGDIKADPLFQPHRLADLAAFYRAFGLEVSGDAAERHDHICLELEFMCVMAAREGYAIEHQLDAAAFEACRDAQRKFLREHLGRWTPAFARRLAAAAAEPSLRALANFTRVFVEAECAAFGIAAGSDDLLLRPVDEAADRMCDSCSLSSLPPGATAAA